MKLYADRVEVSVGKEGWPIPYAAKIVNVVKAEHLIDEIERGEEYVWVWWTK